MKNKLAAQKRARKSTKIACEQSAEQVKEQELFFFDYQQYYQNLLHYLCYCQNCEEDFILKNYTLKQFFQKLRQHYQKNLSAHRSCVSDQKSFHSDLRKKDGASENFLQNHSDSSAVFPPSNSLENPADERLFEQHLEQQINHLWKNAHLFEKQNLPRSV